MGSEARKDQARVFRVEGGLGEDSVTIRVNRVGHEMFAMLNTGAIRSVIDRV